jgi:PilZ domain-containing protein
MQDRRKFERVELPDSARVHVEDAQGKRLGLVKMIGRGGMLVEIAEGLTAGSRHEMYIVDSSEGIRREVQVVVRYSRPEGVGCEFEDLNPDAAVEVGVIIGKYYSARK